MGSSIGTTRTATRGVLKCIANVSGGEWYLPRELEPIVPICQKIARDIRSRYTVGYLPVSANNKAAESTLRVAARSAEGEKLIVRTRTTYRLPERAASK